jgi:hypothetical protein
MPLVAGTLGADALLLRTEEAQVSLAAVALELSPRR